MRSKSSSSFANRWDFPPDTRVRDCRFCLPQPPRPRFDASLSLSGNWPASNADGRDFSDEFRQPHPLHEPTEWRFPVISGEIRHISTGIGNREHALALQLFYM
jgi:hypothetical protein